jgi:hypothetical protein
MQRQKMFSIRSLLANLDKLRLLNFVFLIGPSDIASVPAVFRRRHQCRLCFVMRDRCVDVRVVVCPRPPVEVAQFVEGDPTFVVAPLGDVGGRVGEGGGGHEVRQAAG